MELGRRFLIWNGVALLLLTGYLLLWWNLDALPLLDLPNHIARCTIISSLLFDAESPFSRFYSVELQLAPYITGDLLLAALLRLFDWSVAGRLWITLTYILFPIAVIVYAQSKRVARPALLPLIFALLYLSSDWFFLSGFLNFRLGLAATFFTLAIWESCLREGGNESRQWMKLLCFLLLVALTYLTHLASFVFLLLIVAVESALLVFQGARRTALVGFLPSLLFGANLLLEGGRIDGAPPVFRSPAEKALGIGTMFVRFDMTTDILLAGMLLAVIVLGYWSRGDLRLKFSPEITILAALTLAYVALPVSARQIYDVDNRALPFLAVFTLLAVLPRSGEMIHAERLHLLAACSATLATVNFLMLAAYLPKENERMRAVISAIPELASGKRLLSVATRQDIGRVNSFPHFGAFYVTLRKGFEPYLFSGTNGDAIPYFRIKESLPPPPSLFWYLRGSSIGPEQLAPYDYVAIMEPYDAGRIPITSFRRIVDTKSVDIFQRE